MPRGTGAATIMTVTVVTPGRRRRRGAQSMKRPRLLHAGLLPSMSMQGRLLAHGLAATSPLLSSQP